MLSFYKNELKEIDKNILSTSVDDIPRLFNKIPLGLFGSICCLDMGRDRYPNLDKYLPTMASDDVQMSWTGSCGEVLLQQSVDFAKSVVHFFENIRGGGMKFCIKDANILDFGCGWGRLSRLFLKYTSENQMYAVDPWDESLRHCAEHKVRARFGQTEYICRSLPFEDVKFDLVYAYSVFTHLSYKACRTALSTIHSRMKNDSVLAITVWDKDCWDIIGQMRENVPVKKLQNEHDKKGFAFIPHENLEPIEGEITYGETSVSLEYIEKEWHDWEIIGTDVSLWAPTQKIVFLSPIKK